jgi:hypothetical protein
MRYSICLFCPLSAASDSGKQSPISQCQTLGEFVVEKVWNTQVLSVQDTLGIAAPALLPRHRIPATQFMVSALFLCS